MFASTETQFDNRVLAKSPHSDSAAKEQPPSTSRYSGQVSITGSVDLNLDRDRNCFPQGSVLGMSQAVNQSTESPGNPDPLLIDMAEVNELYWLDLNTTFNVEGDITPNTLHRTSIPNTAPYESGGGFFAGENTIYIYSGLGNSKRYDWMWSYNAKDGIWSRAQVDGGKLNLDERFGGLSAVAPESNLSFFTGGWDMPITGTLVFNSTDGANLQWTNVTKVEGDDAVGEPRIANGGMDYIRLGKKGILVAFGGYDTSKNGTGQTETTQDLRPMDKIGVYDIDSSTCSIAVSSAPDDSSFQVLNGGRSRLKTNATSYDDLYILTLPSFRWIQVPTTGAKPWTAAGVGCDSHKCISWKDGEMIVLGGTTRQNDTVQKGCSRDHPPIRVLNTSKFRWEKQFERETKYSVPGLVSDVVGGDSTGKEATLKEPEGGWGNKKLHSIFSQTVARRPDVNEVPLPSEPTSTQNSSAQPTGPPPPKSSNTGTITGGVIGGVAGLAIIGAIVFFTKRRKQSHRRISNQFNATHAVPTAPSVHYPEPQRELSPTDTKNISFMYLQQEPRELPGNAVAPPCYELASTIDPYRGQAVFELESPVQPPSLPLKD
ncbi:uncharacterized protein PADG_11465 [Paracoccidioides brasiliensis Pb18]|uniref:Kelch repeat protein n=1 Tax=Paracoccidioides brasiliensis (strain Pb18) TaxID=502780 RepID=A0A0A0HUL6_PARBD|nr:uncharacterized protein PADG_11465 [Paracoccidioides brasiliensis Pb18]KGM92277.1 hypothetical protein PADG_11465 [Paracoccidioides brasiliensis Pb18]